MDKRSEDGIALLRLRISEAAVEAMDVQDGDVITRLAERAEREGTTCKALRKERLVGKFLVGAIVALAIVGVVMALWAWDAESGSNRMTSQLMDANSQVTNLSQKLDEAQGQLTEVQAKAEATGQEVEGLKSRLDVTMTERDSAKAAAARAIADAEAAERERDAANERAAKADEAAKPIVAKAEAEAKLLEAVKAAKEEASTKLEEKLSAMQEQITKLASSRLTETPSQATPAPSSAMPPPPAPNSKMSVGSSDGLNHFMGGKRGRDLQSDLLRIAGQERKDMVARGALETAVKVLNGQKVAREDQDRARHVLSIMAYRLKEFSATQPGRAANDLARDAETVGQAAVALAN